MRRFGYIFVLLLLTACTENVDLRLLDAYPLYHGNSSKIWLINKVYTDEVDYTPNRLMDRDVIVFFEQGNKVFVQPISSLGDFPRKVGRFLLDEEDKKLEISFKQENWLFDIISQDEYRIVLKPRETSDFEYRLEFTCYPSKL